MDLVPTFGDQPLCGQGKANLGARARAPLPMKPESGIRRFKFVLSEERDYAINRSNLPLSRALTFDISEIG